MDLRGLEHQRKEGLISEAEALRASHERARKSAWVEAWTVTVNSSTRVSSETATLYADKMLEEYDKRFPLKE